MKLNVRLVQKCFAQVETGPCRHASKVNLLNSVDTSNDSDAISSLSLKQLQIPLNDALKVHKL